MQNKGREGGKKEGVRERERERERERVSETERKRERERERVEGGELNKLHSIVQSLY